MSRRLLASAALALGLAALSLILLDCGRGPGSFTGTAVSRKF
jgi:hypothetical protein